jgi:hypothetical protein
MIVLHLSSTAKEVILNIMKMFVREVITVLCAELVTLRELRTVLLDSSKIHQSNVKNVHRINGKISV